MHRKLASIAAATILVFAATPGWATEKPNAAISYTGANVAFIVGVSFGRGVLHYNGMDYPFTANGISFPSVGGSAAVTSGNVYRLKSIEQFPGNYTAFEAGATFVVGGGGASMRNQNGVVVHLGGVTTGMELTLGPAGVTITLDGPPTPTPTATGTSQ
jgi:hypothetical protein